MHPACHNAYRLSICPSQCQKGTAYGYKLEPAGAVFRVLGGVYKSLPPISLGPAIGQPPNPFDLKEWLGLDETEDRGATTVPWDSCPRVWPATTIADGPYLTERAELRCARETCNFMVSPFSFAGGYCCLSCFASPCKRDVEHSSHCCMRPAFSSGGLPLNRCSPAVTPPGYEFFAAGDQGHLRSWPPIGTLTVPVPPTGAPPSATDDRAVPATMADVARVDSALGLLEAELKRLATVAPCSPASSPAAGGLVQKPKKAKAAPPAGRLGGPRGERRVCGWRRGLGRGAFVYCRALRGGSGSAGFIIRDERRFRCRRCPPC